LLKLENLYVTYESGKLLKKQEIAKSILDEIRTLKRSHQKPFSKAERPISVGGTVRGTANKKRDKIFGSKSYCS
jgi:hypothetical protein